MGREDSAQSVLVIPVGWCSSHHPPPPCLPQIPRSKKGELYPWPSRKGGGEVTVFPFPFTRDWILLMENKQNLSF